LGLGRRLRLGLGRTPVAVNPGASGPIREKTHVQLRGNLGL
jgi:hypothetical protein